MRPLTLRDVQGTTMRTMLAVMLLAATVVNGADQTEVKSSAFHPCWRVLSTPEKLVYQTRDGSDPSRPGTFSLAVSLVDDQGRVGPMSAPTTFTTTTTNWSLRIRPAKVAVNSPAAAWILWMKRDDFLARENAELYEWRPYNGDQRHVVRPYLPLTGLDDHLTRTINIQGNGRNSPNTKWRPFDDNVYWPKTVALPAPSAPSVEVLHTPNVRIGLRFAWVGNDGESLPSEPLYVDPMVGFPAINSSPIKFGRASVLPPNGSLGMHVYASIDEGTTWHRQPAPHYGSDENPSSKNDWLWPLVAQNLIIDHLRLTGVDAATTAGRSWLSSRNRAVYESIKSVLMDSSDPITCPIISPHMIAGVYYDHRTFAARLQQRWDLTTATSTPDGTTNFPTAWPMWVETAQRSRLVGCYMKSATANVGIDMLAYIGSSNFHFRSERTFIVLYSDFIKEDPYTCGIRCIAASRETASNHSASEPIFTDTEILARHPLVVEYGQSANWQCHNITAQSYTHGMGYSTDTEPAVFSINNSGNFKATGRTTTDGGRAVVACMSAKQVKIDEWFSDQGHFTWVVYSGNGGATVKMTAAASNHQLKPFLHLAEVAPATAACNTLLIDGNSGSVGYFDDVWNWYSSVPSSIFAGGRYCGVKYKLSPMGLLNLFQQPSPNWAQWQSASFTQNTGVETFYYQYWDSGLNTANITQADATLGVAVQ